MSHFPAVTTDAILDNSRSVHKLKPLGLSPDTLFLTPLAKAGAERSPKLYSLKTGWTAGSVEQ